MESQGCAKHTFVLPADYEPSGHARIGVFDLETAIKVINISIDILKEMKRIYKAGMKKWTKK